MEPNHLLSNYVDATIISVFPFPINEDKPGVYPRYYHIPAAKDGDIEMLVVKPALMYIELVDRPEKLKLDIPPAQLATSLIRDFIVAQLAYDESAAPGLIAVSGELTDKAFVKEAFKSEIAAIRSRQDVWFRRLVKIADDDWARYHQHKMISDLQVKCAQILKLERDWLLPQTTPSSCPVCKSIVASGAIVCATCHCILDEAAYKKFKFASTKAE